jgi:hypothetical protein
MMGFEMQLQCATPLLLNACNTAKYKNLLSYVQANIFAAK